ncbi:unnamed protein product, partial [Didymodactylos carnosus]
MEPNNWCTSRLTVNPRS